MSMVNALSPHLQLARSFLIQFPDNRCFRSCKRWRISTSMEKSIGERQGENQKQDRTTKNSNAEIFISSSQTTPFQDKGPPLVTALKDSAKQDVACFHFPGHNRGRAAPSSLTQLIGITPFLHDSAGLPNLGTLFSSKGAIFDAQKQASELFGSSETWFLVGGTTCGVQAAIMATCSPGDFLILPRNAHISAISAMILSGTQPKYIVSEYNPEWCIAGGIIPSQVKKAMEELEMHGCRAAAVLVTSPTYHGICSDLLELARMCHSYGIPIIVDEAHGAHFRFHRELPKSALEQGADLAVQSTHKVLSSLMQSSMLHMSGNIVDRDRISKCLQLLQTTSPSHLLLASLDAARAQLSQNPENIFDKATELAVEMANLIDAIPGISRLKFPTFSNFTAIDPLRLTLGVWKLGLSGYEVNDILCDDLGIIPELVGTQSLTFVVNLGTCREHVHRLVLGLEHLSATFFKNGKGEGKMEHKHGKCVPILDISISMSPREAFFASKKRVSVRESVGEICGELMCPYPPGIPVLFPGEIITEKALDYLLELRDNGVLISGASDPLLSSIVVCAI